MSARAIPTALALALLGCTPAPARPTLGAPACATVEVLHPGVVVRDTADAPVAVQARVPCTGAVRTAPEGRAVVRTDEGLELRLAGDTELRWVSGRPQVERGRVFASAWGDGERLLRASDSAVLRLADASLEVERRGASTRVIVVRGELSWQQGSHQGQLAQGELLEGTSELSRHPAGVWDDWTGGAASPQGIARRGSLGAGRMVAHMQPGEAPSPLAINLLNVTTRLQGDTAVTVVTQGFFNGSERGAAVEYRLRLPEGALLGGFRVDQGASGTWSDTVPAMVVSGSGGRVGLVETRSGELYAQLGFLNPGETVRTQITYVEWLHRDGARRTWTYPIGDPVGPQLVGEFSLDVDLSRGVSGIVRAPEGSRLQNEHVVLRRSDWRPRGDLVLELEDSVPRRLPSASLWRSTVEGPDGTEFAMVDVALAPPPESAGTDVAIVLDDSAATDTGTLEVSRAAIDAVLHQLGPRDRVALLFGDLGARPAEGSAGTLGAVDDARREAILDAVAHARPGGASDLGRMLVDAHGRLDPTRNGVVFYLGDATPTVGSLDPDALVEGALRQAPDLRLYALTLGDESHPEVLAPLAARGGRVGRVSDPPEAVTLSMAMMAHALRPCLRDVEVHTDRWLDHPMPSRLETWVLGDPLRVVGARNREKPPGTLTVEARVNGAPQRWTMPLGHAQVADEGDLSRRWARLRVDALTRSGSGRASVAELGARYGLVTRVSGLVLGGTDGTGLGVPVLASAWPEDDLGGRLPALGVASQVGPRGVQGLREDREVPVALDDSAGWSVHVRGAGGDRSLALTAALASAEPAARACVERKRALRPSLAGTVRVSAAVDALGRVSLAQVVVSTLGDAETEGCIRRAVEGVTLPEPVLLGAVPGRVERSFEFPGGAPSGGPAGRVCPSTSQLPRSLRRVLWRERIQHGPQSGAGLVEAWRTARARCELRWWEDRVAFLELALEVLTDPQELVLLRNALGDSGAVDWLDAALARRFGPSVVWRAVHGAPLAVDWGVLLDQLASTTIPLARKLQIVRAWLQVAPRDVDLRLRWMALLEENNQPRDARQVAERLRRDPIADARVRTLTGELLLRVGDRDEALRALTEIAEFAPYDPFARARLGDLLLTYGWAQEARHQYQTLQAVRPGDPLAATRQALAALAAQREDEALRTLRRAAEEAGGGTDPIGRLLQSVLDAEVTRLAQARPADPAVRAWMRVAAQARTGRDAEALVRWTHPDLGVELLARPASEAAFTRVGECPAPLGVCRWDPSTALEGTHLVVRGVAGLQGRRSAEVQLQVLLPGDAGPRRVERVVRLDRATRAQGFVVRSGALEPEPVAPAETPPAVLELY
ncbi:MAG: hypothetical protein HY909_19635 [Deltaproteobacteria bacterium]|nr:hypothetical protein [Deltaproteobacteria bacterium]